MRIDDKNNFDVLDAILEHLNSVKKFYWIAALFFWFGALFTIQYYISQTGTEPSWIPGGLMFIGAGIYFVVRHLK